MTDQELKYFIYCRKSKEENKPIKKILSIESQRKVLINLAEKKQLKIVDIFEENKTAFKPGRPVFNKMMKKIKAGKANSLLVWKIDRLTRNSFDTGKLGWLIDEGKILEICTFDGSKYRNSSDNKFLLDIQFALSQKSSNDTSENVKRDIQRKLEKGEWPGLAPLGYLNITKEGVIAGKSYSPEKQRELEKMERPLKRIEIDPLVGPLVKKLFKYASTGLYSLDCLQEKAKELGLKGRHGRDFSRSMISSLLHNCFYYGAIKFNGNYYEGTHEPLISKSLFDEVDDRIKEKSKPITRHWNQAFKGLIKCPCGCFVTAETKKKENKTTGELRYYTYYHCTRRKGPCDQKAVTEKELEDQFEEKVKEATINDMVKELLTEAIKESHEEEKRIHFKKLNHWQRVYRKCDGRLSRLLDALADGVISTEEFSSKKKDILEQKMEAKQHLESQEEANKVWHDYVGNLIITTNKVYEVFKKGSSENKKAILMAIGKNFLLKDGKVTFEFKEPFNWVSELNKSKSYNLSIVRGRWDLNPRSPS
jgi:site-specific DNA recombinase